MLALNIPRIPYRRQYDYRIDQWYRTISTSELCNYFCSSPHSFELNMDLLDRHHLQTNGILSDMFILMFKHRFCSHHWETILKTHFLVPPVWNICKKYILRQLKEKKDNIDQLEQQFVIYTIQQHSLYRDLMEYLYHPSKIQKYIEKYGCIDGYLLD